MSNDEYSKIDWKAKWKSHGPKIDEKLMSEIQLKFAKKVITAFTCSIVFTVIYAGINVYIDAEEEYSDDYWVRKNKQMLIGAILLWLISTVALTFFG